MRFRGLDLNLLAALDALLAERSVSVAARKLHLSQSAMSSALARLRKHFDDELLLPLGRKMVLTAAAETLQGPLHQLMVQIDLTVGAGLRFDPGRSQRTFVVHASDYITEVVLSGVPALIASEAPHVVLHIVPPVADPAEGIETGDVDLLITPEAYVSPQHPAELLYQEDHVAVGWAGNPAMSGPLTLERFFDLGHVVVRFLQGRAESFADSEIARLQRPRRIELIAPSFTAVPKLLIGTHRISVMHRRLAERFAESLPLALCDLPFPLPALREMIQYHQVRADDAGLQWLKGRIHEAARTATGEPTKSMAG